MNPPVAGGRLVFVPVTRFERWIRGFETRHGSTQLAVDTGALSGIAPDGSDFAAALPFARRYCGPATIEAFCGAADEPEAWGILLVRKSGFAVAAVRDGTVQVSKVGRRYVQGRTKAGGQSQQRFARRRANQAEQAYRVTAEHARRVWADLPADALLITAGDTQGVREVLTLCPGHSTDRVHSLPLDLPEPRQQVLEETIGQARAIQVRVTNLPGE